MGGSSRNVWTGVPDHDPPPIKQMNLRRDTRQRRGRTRRKSSRQTAPKSSALSDIQLKLGKRIRRLREEKGLSEAQLAQACNLWRGHIGKIERGDHNIKLTSLREITRKLGAIEQMLKGIV